MNKPKTIFAKYPKLIVLVIAIISAYLIFSKYDSNGLIVKLGTMGYAIYFIAGIFFAFGFTAPFSAGIFITSNPENIILAGILGGFGALIADLLIFKFIKFSFMDEFDKLRKSKHSKKIINTFRKSPFAKLESYLMYAFAGILIASPLPDEAGIIILAGLSKIKQKTLAVISFFLNTVGILVLMSL
jgi:hypothetical protein